MQKIFFVLMILFPLLWVGCGRSPFLKDQDVNNSEQIINELSGELTLERSHLLVQPYWIKGPVVGDECQLIILILNERAKPVNIEGEFKIKLWMPTMGHGSFPISVKNIAPGTYQASEIFFTMPGYWDIHFQIFNQSQLLEEVKWGLNL